MDHRPRQLTSVYTSRAAGYHKAQAGARDVAEDGDGGQAVARSMSATSPATTRAAVAPILTRFAGGA
jgi:hypothetical protein